MKVTGGFSIPKLTLMLINMKKVVNCNINFNLLFIFLSPKILKFKFKLILFICYKLHNPPIEFIKHRSNTKEDFDLSV